VLITGGEDGKLAAWHDSGIEGELTRSARDDVEMEMSTSSPSSPEQERRRKMKRSSSEDLSLANKVSPVPLFRTKALSLLFYAHLI
jgi:hypothetical protein